MYSFIILFIYFFIYFFIFAADYTFYLGLVFDGYDAYKDITDYELAIITDSPHLKGWDQVKPHKSGNILSLQVSVIQSNISFIGFWVSLFYQAQ